MIFSSLQSQAGCFGLSAKNDLFFTLGKLHRQEELPPTSKRVADYRR